MRVPINVLEDTWWKKWRDEDEMEMMRSEGQMGLLGLGVENNRKGGGRGSDGVVKLLISSKKILYGGGKAVITSSIPSLYPIHQILQNYARRYVI